MNVRFLPLLVLASLAVSCGTLSAQHDEKTQQRIDASFLLSFGRLPSPEERVAKLAGKPSVPELFTAHADALTRDPAARQVVATRACEDALGRSPSETELATWSREPLPYAGHMRRHVQWLAGKPDEYRAVIDRAYQLVVRRPAHAIEHEYWAGYETMPFILLAASIENWAKRNAPGLMSTTGVPSVSVNSAHLTPVRLAPDVAREFRAALGLAANFRGVSLEVCDHTVVAPGSESVVSVGGIHFAAAGRRPGSQNGSR